nr:transposase [Crocosphaera watsonii]
MDRRDDKQLEEYFKVSCEKQKCELLEFGPESDHCHLLVSFHPNNNISIFGQKYKIFLKSSSSQGI